MSPDDVLFIRQTLGLSQHELSKALNIAPFTVARWEKRDGGNEPSGLQAEILRALHSTALDVAGDVQVAKAVGTQLALGIGALIYRLMKQEVEFMTTTAKSTSAKRAKRSVRSVAKKSTKKPFRPPRQLWLIVDRSRGDFDLSDFSDRIVHVLRTKREADEEVADWNGIGRKGRRCQVFGPWVLTGPKS